MTEYSHSMGNATGSIYEYWEYVRANDMALGGFIWDLIDQGRKVSLSGDIAEGSALTESASGRVGQVQLTSKSNFVDVSDEKALTTKAISKNSYIVFDDADGAVNALLSGSGKSFTLEAIVKPESLNGNQIIVAKGDTQIAIKTQKAADNLRFIDSSPASAPDQAARQAEQDAFQTQFGQTLEELLQNRR